MVLICISLMVNDVEHLFMCLSAILIYCLEKYQFTSSIFLTGLFLLLLLLLSWLSSLYILNINFLSYTWFAKIFSHSVGCLFILLIIYFAVPKIWVWHSFICWFLLSLFVLLAPCSKIITTANIKEFLPQVFL